MTELRTDRLVLRRLALDDLDVMLSIRNEPRVIPSTGTGEELPRERMERQIKRWLEVWRDRGFGTRIILLDEVPVGWVDVNLMGEDAAKEFGIDANDIELGVLVHPEHWGSGIAGEAGLAVAADAFSRVGLERLYATVDPEHAASLRALAKSPNVRLVAESADERLYELRQASYHAPDG